jgi:hypothetical protein
MNPDGPVIPVGPFMIVLKNNGLKMPLAPVSVSISVKFNGGA